MSEFEDMTRKVAEKSLLEPRLKGKDLGKIDNLKMREQILNRHQDQNRRNKLCAKIFSVPLDLTKHCHILLAKAKGLTKDNPSVAYAFSDINCSLALTFNDNTSKYFNSERKLKKLLEL